MAKGTSSLVSPVYKESSLSILEMNRSTEKETRMFEWNDVVHDA